MPSIAVLVGNTNYRTLTTLECCAADLNAMEELLRATGKYDKIEVIQNADSSALKDKLRSVLGSISDVKELFFYYTGHGYSNENDFFYCSTNFDTRKPNETGLSTEELHTFLRLSNAELVVKVADACNSGTQLIKSDLGLSPFNKQGFRNLIQISSCLDTQSALTGDPLSLFTEKFRNAALAKSEGVVHYMDVIGSLRDQFIGSDGQTPFFVQQGTGREEFVDDAHKLDDLRAAVKVREEANSDATNDAIGTPSAPPTLIELLNTAESKLATPEAIGKFIETLFASLRKKMSAKDFGDLFYIEFVEHDSFKEDTSERFIIEIMSREKRTDNFVTAEYSRKFRRSNPAFLGAIASSLSRLYDDEQFVEMYDLQLNCKMARVQLKVTFTPKFSTLQRIILVVTCAPSLEHCYVFEVVTIHMLNDFGKYDETGANSVRRWYKISWSDNNDGFSTKITGTLFEKIKDHIENAAKRLGPSS